jgi:1,4-alpha-glucan branching enzyme
MDKLYDLMNWRNIEGIEYSDISNPSDVLGKKMTKSGLLIGAFVPNAKSVSVKVDGIKKIYNMELMDEEGYYAVLLPKTTKGNYQLVTEYEDGTTSEYYDPYQFKANIPVEKLKEFNAGICYDVYKYLGAHKAVVDGVLGYSFAVWAPFAQRVSVVGDFNLWDGRRNMMDMIEDTGVFTTFIPGIKSGDLYKFEIRKKDNDLVLKADPYATYSELRPETASVTFDSSSFEWTDDNWVTARSHKKPVNEPLSIYELHLGSWKKPEDEDKDPRELFYNYKELAPMVAKYVKEMGYTHIELMPIMEHPFDASWGYQVTGYYATTARYGTPLDFKFFIDYMHKEGIGVILDWVPAHFPKDLFGLAQFDGTCLYEHENPLQGLHPDWGTLIFNYGRPEVSNFLIANAIYWANEFHIDGLRMDAVASMLYLDYCKQPGQWIPNIYGGNENLEAIELFKHLNSQFKARTNGALLIAEDSTAWTLMTSCVEEDGLGFDFKWNMGWMNDFLSYMETDPYFRQGSYNQLTFSMIYQYSENFVLVLSHDEVVHGKGSMINKMFGDTTEKFKNLRAAYGYMMTHPGKKLLFMGQDFGQDSEWSNEKGLDWDEMQNPLNLGLKEYVKELNKLYTSDGAMYELDQDIEGFKWINCVSPVNSTLSFVRQGINENDMLLVVCNFDTISYDEFVVGVPKYGKYKEVLNSDSQKFGGSGLTNQRVKTSKKVPYDGKEQSITIALPALSVCIFKYEYVEEKIVTKKVQPKKETTKEKKKTTPKTVTKSKIAIQLEKQIVKADTIREKEEDKTLKKVIQPKKKAPAKTTAKEKAIPTKTVAKEKVATTKTETKTTAKVSKSTKK